MRKNYRIGAVKLRRSKGVYIVKTRGVTMVFDTIGNALKWAFGQLDVA